jgi:hypothetical protein
MLLGRCDTISYNDRKLGFVTERGGGPDLFLNNDLFS